MRQHDPDRQLAGFIVKRRNPLLARADKFILVAEKGNAAFADGRDDVKRGGIFAQRRGEIGVTFSNLPVPEK